MSAVIIDGLGVANKVRAALAEEIQKTKTVYGKVPGIAVVLVGDDPASHVYVANKEKAALAAGMYSVIRRLPADTHEEALLELIDGLNADPAIHGILVQMPLPKQIDEFKVIMAIEPKKDVDGFHPINVGYLNIGKNVLTACTPKGVMHLLREYNINPESKHAVVIGRSNIVGKPMAALLVKASATVTICHSRTKDLPAICRQADILIAAVGRAKMVTADYVKKGAVVIDVGMNRVDGKLCGDVDFENVAEIASAITPVPKGVGPMTIAMLLENTYEAFKLAL